MSPAGTGVAWSPVFAEYDRGPGSAFLPRQALLPDDRWDQGRRVECLYVMLEHARNQLPTVEAVTFDAVGEHDVLAFHDMAITRSVVSADPTVSQAGLLAVGAVRELCRRVHAGRLANGYALVRPAGHHATASSAGGGCMFANGVLAALELKRLGVKRILYLDRDAHHGNSQQEAFWSDPTVLTISIHQARKFVPQSGGTDAQGVGNGRGANINVPVPPGSGGGVYRAVFQEVIRPAVAAFRPEFILVSSVLDANYIDPSARLCLHAADYGWMTAQVLAIAGDHCDGRVVMTHEGGYALSYLPICFLRIIETLSGSQTTIEDPFLQHWGEDFAAAVSCAARRVVQECVELARDVPSTGPP